MPITRSATKKQTTLEEFGQGSQSKVEKSEHGKSNQPTTTQSAPHKSSKRKTPQSEGTKDDEPRKKKVQQHVASDTADNLEHPIIINRAPVLQLWGAVVAQFLHPQLKWSACLSIGSAISSLCAISKGRAIGMIEPKDEEKNDTGMGRENAEVIPVMGFDLHLDKDAVLISGKPKTFSETALKAKFGEKHYDAVKNAMVESLETWINDKDELDKKAFHMYERFRPNIAKGQQGWGRKGELNLHEVANTIKRTQD